MLALSPRGRRYGYIPNAPDHRDFGAARLHFAPSLRFSEHFLDEWLGPVRDQGDEGSCTAQSSAGDQDFQLRHYDPRFKDKPELTPVMSAQFIYRLSRVKNGTQNQDSGSDGRTTCQVLNEFGTCTEKSWPYVAGDIMREPTTEQLAEAATFKSGAYHFLYTVDDMKSCIASEYCFRLGFAVFESFEEKTGSTTVYSPKHGESLMGYHEVLVKGYSDSQFGGAFSVRNSWGKSWGVGGDFWLPYDVIVDKKIFSDAVIQHRGKRWAL